MIIRYMINRIINWLFFFYEKYLTQMRRTVLKKQRVLVSYFSYQKKPVDYPLCITFLCLVKNICKYRLKNVPKNGR